MPVTISWQQVAIRLLCAVIAGAIIGINRDEKGRPAGMRTNILVCLAACIAMIQANLLMPTAGKASDSFIVLDLMRLPLGILSGIGFIGAGAILRKGEMIIGVTTAASLWIVTVLGLCFGGGQILLGTAGLVLSILTLWTFKWFERRIPHRQRGTLSLTIDERVVDEHEILSRLKAGMVEIHSWGLSSAPETKSRSIQAEVRWNSPFEHSMPPKVIEDFLHTPGILHLDWRV